MIRQVVVGIGLGSPMSMGLRFDGVYQSTSVDDCMGQQFYDYYRFFSDGHIIRVNSCATPEQLASWFNLEHEDATQGRFTIMSDRVVFTFEHVSGNVDYEGSVADDTLTLQNYSHIDQHRGEYVFKFFQVDMQ